MINEKLGNFTMIPDMVKSKLNKLKMNKSPWYWFGWYDDRK